jgi:hypothetical protein
MVFLDTLFALFFLCFSFGLILIVGSKKQLNTLFGLLLMMISGIMLLSISQLSAENFIFVIFGLLAISIMFAFQIRDNLIISLEKENKRSDNNG